MSNPVLESVQHKKLHQELKLLNKRLVLVLLLDSIDSWLLGASSGMRGQNWTRFYRLGGERRTIM